MKGLLAILLVATFAFAGCTGKSSSTTTATTASGSTSTSKTTTGATTTAATTTMGTTASQTTTSSSTTTTSSHSNHAPTIGTFSASRLNATSLSFTFAFTGSDPDRDALSWSLDANSDSTNDASGTNLPGSANFTYAASGLYNATLTVSDGNLTATQKLAVNATTSTGPVLTATVKWTIGTVWCQPYPYAVPHTPATPPQAVPFKHGTPAANVLYGEVALPAAAAGKAYTANFGAQAVPMGGVDEGIVAFYDGSDTLLGYGSSIDDPMLVTGTVPAGAATAALFNCAGPAPASVPFVIG